ncbi:MAG: ATP-binding protein, partial [Anaerolineales bacterium]
MSIAVTSHVGRDLLQNGAYFNSAPKVVMEYVSNSIDNAPDGQVVRVEVEIGNSQISITDNANGMAQADLMHFFTMHGVNRQRKRGRKVRGRFGTGKSAAFGIADGLRVETVRDGLRNVVQLHRNDILRVPDGSAIPVEHLVDDEATDDPNGTSIIVYDLQLDKIFITPVRERLERALGRHLDMHEVYVNNRRLKYRRPEAVKTFTFNPPGELLAQLPNTSPMKISVAREALSGFENGVAILANGFLNAMDLGSATGKPHTERIFGEVEVPDLDDEKDDEHFPAFDNTRDLSLNDQNPRAQIVLEWVSECVETVRGELDIEAQLARLSEVSMHMQDAADFVSELINADFGRVQRRLRVASQSMMETNSMGSSDVVEVAVERPQPQPEAQRPDAEPEAEPEERAFPAIDYSEPDPPEAEPVHFEAPEAPQVEEETTPDEAFESFVEYMGELDYLEEKAYHEAILQEVAKSETLTPQERRDLVQDILTQPEYQPKQPEPVAPAPEAESQRYDQPLDMTYSSNTEYRSQHVVSDHEVLLTQDAAA